MAKNTVAYIQEFSSRFFPRWHGMVVVIIGLVATAVPIAIGLSKANVDWWWIALFLVAIILFVVYSFLLFRNVAIERDELKWRENTIFYPRRPGMEAFESFIKKYDKLWAIYGTGESLESNRAYDVSKFERVILIDPDGKHTKTMPDGFHLIDQAQMRTKIENVTKYINDTVAQKEGQTKVRWSGGCHTFSLTLGNPLSGNGGAFLEVYVPYEAGHLRPSFLFTQKDQPELFGVLRDSFEKIWGASGENK